MARKKKTEETEKTEEKKSKKKNEPNIGDILELTIDHKCLCKEMLKGTRVKVVGKSERGYAINDNPENPDVGFTMIECGFEL